MELHFENEVEVDYQHNDQEWGEETKENDSGVAAGNHVEMDNISELFKDMTVALHEETQGMK